jgi:hypothetical protein
LPEDGKGFENGWLAGKIQSYRPVERICTILLEVSCFGLGWPIPAAKKCRHAASCLKLITIGNQSTITTASRVVCLILNPKHGVQTLLGTHKSQADHQCVRMSFSNALYCAKLYKQPITCL